MRQPQNGKTSRENISLTIGKKKNVRKSKRASNRRNSKVTMENLECINDALRDHRAYGLHGTWKLVPKDSCQVYKDQRKRQDNTKAGREKANGKGHGKRPAPGRKEGKGKAGGRDSKGSSDRDKSFSDDESRYSREKPVKVSKKSKKTPKKKKKNKSRQRASSDESVSSCTTYSGTSMSSTRSSDMDH